MADEEKTIRINAEDDTGKAINSAGANFNRLSKDIQRTFHQTASGGLVSIRGIEQMAKRTGQSYDDTLKKVVAVTEATRVQTQAAQQAARATQQQTQQTVRLEQATVRAARQQTVLQRLMQTNMRTGGGGPTGVAGYGYGQYGPGGLPPGGGGGGGGPPVVVPVGRGRGGGPPPPPGGGGGGLRGMIGGGLMGMAARFIAPAAGLETARRSFMNYATFDTKLRLTQNQTGMLRSEIDELGKSMKSTAAITGESAESMIDAWNELREAGNFTPEQTTKMFDEVAKSAIGAGANIQGYARSLGDIMRNLKVPVEEYGKVNEAMAYAAKEFNINLDEVGPSLSRVTAYMGAFGYKGADGAARLVAFLGTVKEATGSASKAGTVLSRVMGGLADDTLGKALGFATGGLERTLKRSKDPLGSLIRFIREARDKEAVRKALGIEDIAVFEKFLEQLDTMGDKINKVKSASGAASAGENILQGPDRAAKRLMESLTALTRSLGELMHSAGVTWLVNEFAKVFTHIAETIESVIEGLTMIKNWDFSKMKSWEQRKYEMGAAKDEKNKPIMPWSEYSAIKTARGTAAADAYYNKAVKDYENKNKKIVTDKKSADDKREAESAQNERKALQKKYPELNLPDLPTTPTTPAPTTTVPIPRAAPSTAPPVFQEGLPSTSVPEPTHTPAPARPAPAPTGPMQQFKMPTPEEREQLLRQQQKLGAALEDTTAKLVSYGDAVERSRGEGGLVQKASYTGPVTAQGTATGAGTIGTVAAGGVAPVGQTGGGQADGSYGGSGDARVFKASYTPSGHGYVTSPGGGIGGTPASGRAGPGGRGSGFGSGTTLAPPGRGNYPSAPTTAPTAPTSPRSTATYATGSQKQQTAQTVANAFREAGYSEAAIAGVLKNVEEESSFKADERHFDQPKFAGTEAGYAHGLFQMGGTEWNDYAAHLKKKGLDPMTAWKDPKEQASYLAQRIKTHPGYRELNKILSDPKTTKEQAAQAFVRLYERPSKENLRRREEHYAKGVPDVEKYTGPKTGETPPPASAETPPPAALGEGGGVEEAQSRVAATRKGALDPQLREALEYAAEASGVKVRVTSGGQRMHGAPGATGSHRHDKGRAADLDVIDPKTGKVLALDDPRRLKFLEESAAAGAGGTGTRYMDDPKKIHAGITGAGAEVGKGLGAYAGPAHERAAVERGLRRMMTPEQVAAARKAQIAARKTPAVVATPAPTTGSERAAPTVEAPPTAPTQLPDQDRQMNVNLRVNDNEVQFARSSMRRQADREVREARWNSYSDIGAA